MHTQTICAAHGKPLDPFSDHYCGMRDGKMYKGKPLSEVAAGPFCQEQDAEEAMSALQADNPQGVGDLYIRHYRNRLPRPREVAS